MKIGNKAVKAGIGYTVGNILIKGINFLTIPIFSRLMTTEQFGLFNVFISYDSFLYVLIGLALHSSIKSAYYKYRLIDDYVSSISLIYILNTFFFFGLSLLFSKWLTICTGFNEITLVALVFYSAGSALITLYNEKISLFYQYKEYLRIAFLNSSGTIVLSLILMLTFFNGNRGYGRIAGATLSIAILGIFVLYKLYVLARPRFSREYWKFAITYSFPIIPHGLSQVLLAQFDRIMIQKIVGNSEAGIYSLAANVQLILTVVTTSISASWSTWIYDKLNANSRQEIRKKAWLLVKLFLLLTITLMTISPELIMILGGKEYMSGSYVSIPLLLVSLVLFIYTIIIPSEYYMQKTGFIMLGTVAAAIINVVTNYVFISKYGYIAAAYTTLFSYICYMIFHMIISNRLLSYCVLPIRKTIICLVTAAIFALFDLLFISMLLPRLLAYVAFLMVFLFFMKKDGIDIFKIVRKML